MTLNKNERKKKTKTKTKQKTKNKKQKKNLSFFFTMFIDKKVSQLNSLSLSVYISDSYLDRPKQLIASGELFIYILCFFI